MGKEKTQQREYAKLLYLDTQHTYTIREIAERVGVRPNTVSMWIKKYRWDKLRKSLLTTRKKLISDLYDQLEALNRKIKSRDDKAPDPKEANTIAVITNSIKRLENETSAGQIYEVMTDFLEFLKQDHWDLYRELLPHADAYITHKLNE